MSRGISTLPRRENTPGPSASAAAKGTIWWSVSAGLHGLAVAGLVVWGGGGQQLPMPAFQVDIVMEQPGAPPGAMAQNTVPEVRQLIDTTQAGDTKPIQENVQAKPEQTHRQLSKAVFEAKPRDRDRRQTPENRAVETVPPTTALPLEGGGGDTATASLQSPPPSRARVREGGPIGKSSAAPAKQNESVIGPAIPLPMQRPAEMAMLPPPPSPRQKPVLPFISIITKSKQMAEQSAETSTPALIPAAATAFRPQQAVHTERNGPPDAASESGLSTGPQPDRQAGIQAGIGAGIDQQAAAGPAARPPKIDGEAGNPAPRYPYLARERGWEGRVVLRVAVDAAGLPGDIAIGRSSGRDMLDRAAMAAVRKWRFRPAIRLGRPVAGMVEIPISFRLRNDSQADR